MEHKSFRDVKDLDWVRDQILTFACGAHAFGLELDEYEQDAEWNAVFLVNFKGTDREERMYVRAVKGEQHIRFGVEVMFDEDKWRENMDEILDKASEFDVALCPISAGTGQKRLARLTTRAWVPNFSQRIFGLTFSNLMDCKEALG